jgi:Xaa-Pro aminopeptidase
MPIILAVEHLAAIPGSGPRNLQLGHPTPEQAAALDAVFRALNAADARLKNGKHIDNYVDTVRWILDQIHRQIAR